MKMATKKSTNNNSVAKDKWKSTGGSMKPVDLSKIELVNRPTATKKKK